MKKTIGVAMLAAFILGTGILFKHVHNSASQEPIVEIAGQPVAMPEQIQATVSESLSESAQVAPASVPEPVVQGASNIVRTVTSPTFSGETN